MSDKRLYILIVLPIIGNFILIAQGIYFCITERHHFVINVLLVALWIFTLIRNIYQWRKVTRANKIQNLKDQFDIKLDDLK